MKFVSFNVNGLRSILKKTFIEDFTLMNADIFSLNETKLSDDNFPFVPEGYNVYHTFSKVRKGYSGVAVFSKFTPLSVHYGLLENKYDEEGRVITLEFSNFYYVACYVPNAGDELKRMDFRMQFEKDLIEYFASLNKPIVYCGDLNVAHNPIDLKNPKANTHNAGFTIEERTAFNTLLSTGLVDTYRYLYPENVKYSWWSYMFNARKNNAGWRIDYYLVSEEIKDKIIDAEIHNEVFGSDHCPVSLTIDL
jgi:exodeoxyribonuclease-3